MSEGPTNLSFWEDKELHHKIHERVGETLFYYLVRVRPVEPDEWANQIKSVAANLQIGMLHIYPVFGPWDALIRVWLHPRISKAFQMEIASHTSAHHPFAVSKTVQRWYDAPRNIETHLLEEIDEKKLREVQSGQNKALFRKLREGHLVAVRDIFNETAISFYVYINIDSGSTAQNDQVIIFLHSYLSANPSIRNASIYTGFGFCSILFSGQVQAQDYFEIAKLPRSLRRQFFNAFGIDTETFLLLGKPLTIGKEPIGEATFLGLRGINLFVHSLIPELYEVDFKQKASVENFIIEEARNREFSPEDKGLIRNYLIGFINEDVIQMESSLFTYLSGLERYLRTNHAKFIGVKTKKPTQETYQAAKVASSSKHVALGDLFQLYSVVIANTDSDNKHLSGDWEDLANLRNQVAHADEGFETRWREHLKILFKHLPRVHQLKLLIESCI